LREKRESKLSHDVLKKNSLTNRKALDKLNPYAKITRERERKRSEEASKKRQE